MANYREGLHLVPEHMHEAVERYIEYGIPPGNFLEAVLANDLLGAFGRADSMNKNAMARWAEFVYNYLPINSHGSREIVANWKGLKEKV